MDLLQEIPDVIIREVRMLIPPSKQMRFIVILCVVLLLVYMIVVLGMLYRRDKKLDQLMEMATDMEMRMMNLQHYDQMLDVGIAQLQENRCYV